MAPKPSRSSATVAAPVARAIASAVSRARRSGLVSTTATSSPARLRPSSAACSRPRAVRRRASSGSPGAASACRTSRSRTGAHRRARRDAAREPLRSPVVRAFRYVVADVFTDTPLTGNQLAVFTDARDLYAARDAGARARDAFLRDGLRAAAAGGRPRAHADLHADARSCRSPAIPCSARRSCSARRCSSGRSRSKPAPA